MVKYKEGNIFESDCKVLVNPVNIIGVMGGGLALDFKNKFPSMFDAYVKLCEFEMLKIGKPHLWHGNGKDVLLFPTKTGWRLPSRLEYVKSGLDNFVQLHKFWGIQSIAFPALGCGLGGLSWREVGPVMDKYLEPLSIEIEIYLPVVA